MALHRLLAGIVAGQREPQVAVEVVQQPAQIGHAAAQVLVRVPGVRDAEALGRRRNQLHQPLGLLVRLRLGVEVGLHLDDGEHQLRAQPVAGGQGPDQPLDVGPLRRPRRSWARGRVGLGRRRFRRDACRRAAGSWRPSRRSARTRAPAAGPRRSGPTGPGAAWPRRTWRAAPSAARRRPAPRPSCRPRTASRSPRAGTGPPRCPGAPPRSRAGWRCRCSGAPAPRRSSVCPIPAAGWGPRSAGAPRRRDRRPVPAPVATAISSNATRASRRCCTQLDTPRSPALDRENWIAHVASRHLLESSGDCFRTGGARRDRAGKTNADRAKSLTSFTR